MDLDDYNLAKPKAGFTIVELLIVGIIALILVMMALVSFRGFYKATEFENTVDKMISFIRYAQTQAVVEWRTKNVIVLPDEGKLVLKLKKDEDKEFKLPKDYSMESDTILIAFGGAGGFDCMDIDDPTINKTTGWIKIRRESTEDEAKIELWGFGGHIKVESISLGRK